MFVFLAGIDGVGRRSGTEGVIFLCGNVGGNRSGMLGC